MIEFRDLGTENYRDTWTLQQNLHNEVIGAKQLGKQSDYYVLLVEHPPVYTLGRNGNEANILRANNDAEVIKVDRGGDITFHGLGQLVVYPIIDLDYFKLGLKDYIHNLEDVVIRTVERYGLKAERINGFPGVWLGKNTSYERKICAIGVKCSHYVSMHGLALNVNTNLSYFDYINPCGFTNKYVTSIAKEVGKPINFDEVKAIITEEFKTVFGVQ